MKRLFQVFCWGLLISFLGTLPFGTLNVAAMQLSISEGITPALYFAVGVLVVEMVYVRFSLVGIEWIRRKKRLMHIMEWITLVLMLVLAAGSFGAALRDGGTSKNLMLENGIHRLLLGVFMSAVNPVQIPFWFGWSTILFSKGILQNKKSQFDIYILGIGLGTFAGTSLFIFGGAYLVKRIAAVGQYMNWVIGSIFLITAIIQFYKILRKKDAVAKLDKMDADSGGVQ